MKRFKLVLVGAAAMTTMAVYAAPAMAATDHENMGHENMSHENNNDRNSVRDDRNVNRDDRNVNRDDNIFSNSFLDDFFSPELLSLEGFDSI